MYSKSHLAISAALGLAIAVWIDADPARAAFLVGYAAVVGTAIDLDHFAIARLRTGDWSSLRFALSNPRAAVLEQDRIFAEGEVGAVARLLSHVMVGGLLVLAVAAIDPFLAAVAGAVLAVHVASDLIHDVVRAARGPQSA